MASFGHADAVAMVTGVGRRGGTEWKGLEAPVVNAQLRELYGCIKTAADGRRDEMRRSRSARGRRSPVVSP